MKLKTIGKLYGLIQSYREANHKHKNNFHVNYKCKFKNIPSKIYISNENVMIKQAKASEVFRLKDIRAVHYRVKFWSIEVVIQTPFDVYKCHFPTKAQARACYEQFIYQKIRVQKN